MIELDFVIGDSIAAGMALELGLKRSAANGVESRDENGISKVGARPSEILNYLKSFNLNGKKILLSTGYSNNPNELEKTENKIKEQLQHIKDNSGSAYVAGVSNNPPKRNDLEKLNNTKLKTLVESFGFVFLGGFEPADAAQIHPNYKNYIQTAFANTTLQVRKKFLQELTGTTQQDETKLKEEFLENIAETLYTYLENIHIAKFGNLDNTGLFNTSLELYFNVKNAITLDPNKNKQEFKNNVKKVTKDTILPYLRVLESTGGFLFTGSAATDRFILEFFYGVLIKNMPRLAENPSNYNYFQESLLADYYVKFLGPKNYNMFIETFITTNTFNDLITNPKKFDLITYFGNEAFDLIQQTKDQNGFIASESGIVPTSLFGGINSNISAQSNWFPYCSFGSIFRTLLQNGIGISTAAYSTNDDIQNGTNVDVQIIGYTFNEKAGPILSNLPIMMMPVNLERFKYEYGKLIFGKKDTYMTIDEFLAFFFESFLNDPRSITNPLHVFYTPWLPPVGSEPQNQPQIEDKAGYDDYIANAEPMVIPQICGLLETLTEDEMDGEILVKKGDKTFSGKKKKILRIHIFDKTKNPYENIKEVQFNETNRTFSVIEDFGENYYGDRFEEPRPVPVKFQPGFSNIALRNFLSQKVPVIQIGHTTSNVTSVSITSNQNPRDTANRVTQFYKSDTNIGGNLKNNDIFNLPIRIIPANLSMTTVGCPLPEIGQYYYIDLGTGTSLDSLYMVSKVSHTFGQGKFETSLEFVPKDGLAQFEQAIINTKTQPTSGQVSTTTTPTTTTTGT
jgi:hypothetical protein